MFNPHMHQQQQQQQQFQQHLRQLHQLFHQQQPPPPAQPPAGRHVPHPHQGPRPMPVMPQSVPPSRMVNLCQTTQTTIIAPNPMLQGAMMMQQMQGNMRGFGMGGQQFRQFFAGARSSLLGPMPMGVAIKSPMMGFPPARPPYNPHQPRYYNNNQSVPGPSPSPATSSTPAAAAVARQPEKRDIEQVSVIPLKNNEDQPGPSTATEADGAGGHVRSDNDNWCYTITDEYSVPPDFKKQKMHSSEVIEEIIDDTEEERVPCTSDAEILSSNNDDVEEIGSTVGSEVLDSDHTGTAAETQEYPPDPVERSVDAPAEEAPPDEDLLDENQEVAEDGVDEGPNKYYCYLCSITCPTQNNFRNHMNSISHQQRMMEIQHMSNACLVTLLPRLHDTLQGAAKDGEKNEWKRWCASCHTDFTCSILEHRQTQEHKIARKMCVSSCTICHKNFKSSQSFLKHLQSAEHRKKVEMDDEGEGCMDQTKIPDGLLVEEEGADSEEEDRAESDKQVGTTSTEVTAENMDASVQYDPDTLYGGSFLVPVAGFICRLCNKFYHFESSSLHSHCKSLEHFENLKRSKTDQKHEARDEESGPCSPRPTADLTPDQPQELRPQTKETLQDITFKTDADAAAAGADATDADATDPAAVDAALTDTVTSDTAPCISTDETVEEETEVKGKKGPKPRRRTTRARR
ncbi:unnamed protein product [Knipowitschia caucasica]|uniref:Matrin-type domain-containing protein n=1 Tax=Knipowitschia caucasica TaxID=637954 RepID=A0AAV2IZT2_KNICA